MLIRFLLERDDNLCNSRYNRTTDESFGQKNVVKSERFFCAFHDELFCHVSNIFESVRSMARKAL